jgi:hypothetical protein
MKLGQAIAWLMGSLQRSLSAHLEDCWKTPLTAKEQELVSILELVRIEQYVPRSTISTLYMGGGSVSFMYRRKLELSIWKSKSSAPLERAL